MSDRYALRLRRAERVFDVVDGFAADRGLAGPRPRPISPVRVFVSTGDGGESELVLRTNRDGYALYFGQLRLPGGAVRRVALSGTYTLRAEARYYQAAEFPGVPIPAGDQPEPYQLVLRPGPDYPFPVATEPASRAAATRPAATRPAVRPDRDEPAG
jgi:hypothetical protein